MAADTHDTIGRVAERMSELADALARALPPAVLDRLSADLDGDQVTSATLVLELARARRWRSATETAIAVGGHEPSPPATPATEAAPGAPALSQDDLPDVAARLTELSIEFDRAGNRRGALAASMQSVRLYCLLAQKQPGVHLPGLAASLNNIGVDFMGFGQLDEACAAIAQSITIRRVLAGRRPELYLQDLAVSLNNYGSCLVRLCRADDALAANREATEIRVVLAERSPQDFLPVLASTLANLSVNLTRLGRRSEARAINQLATEICARVDGTDEQVGCPSSRQLAVTRARATCLYSESERSRIKAGCSS